MYQQTYSRNGASIDVTRTGNDVEVITRPDDDTGVVVTMPLTMLESIVKRARLESPDA